MYIVLFNCIMAKKKKMYIILLIYKIMCICSRAILYSGVEPAMQWVLEHMADPGVYICYTMPCISMMCYKKHDFFFFFFRFLIAI